MTDDLKTFEFEVLSDILIIVPSEEFAQLRDNDVRNAYNDAYRRLTEGNYRHVLFDFSSLEYFGSTFVGIMVRLAKKARQDGGEAVLCHMSEMTKDMLRQLMLLENTKTDFFWTPFESREEAVEWLQTRPPKEKPDADTSGF